MQYGRGYYQGTERYVSILCAGLRRRGHEALVLAGDPERRGAAADLGAAVPGESGVLHYPTRGWMAVRGVGPARLAALLRDQRPDVVHLANPAHIGIGLIEASRRVGVPIVATIMDYWWLCPKHTLHHTLRGLCDGRVPARECIACIAAEEPGDRLKSLHRLPVLRSTLLPALYFARWTRHGVPPAEIHRWVRRRRLLAAALRELSAVILPSAAAAKIVGPYVAPERRRTIPYGLESRWFEAASRPRHPPGVAVEPARLVVGYAGALAPHKGVHTLIEAMKRLEWRHTRVRIAGRGEEEYRHKLESHALGLNVEFAGPVPSEEMPAFLGSLDVLVLPSLWPENLPIVALEATASRVPLIASRIPGVAELIDDEARLFSPGDADALAACLSAFAAAPSPASSAPLLTADDMVERTLAVYREAAGGGERTRPSSSSTATSGPR